LQRGVPACAAQGKSLEVRHEFRLIVLLGTQPTVAGRQVDWRAGSPLNTQ
jgi:hypothetical protein